MRSPFYQILKYKEISKRERKKKCYKIPVHRHFPTFLCWWPFLPARWSVVVVIATNTTC